TPVHPDTEAARLSRRVVLLPHVRVEHVAQVVALVERHQHAAVPDGYVSWHRRRALSVGRLALSPETRHRAPSGRSVSKSRIRNAQGSSTSAITIPGAELPLILSSLQSALFIQRYACAFHRRPGSRPLPGESRGW